MATTIARNARDDRQGPANQSPFRSCNPSKRYIAALEMIQKREEELEALHALLAGTSDTKTQRILAQRIRATKNNLASWEAYFSGKNEKDEACYREPRAVIQPRPPKKSSKKSSQAA